METQVSEQKKIMDIKKILSIIPHRYPFLLVDKILDFDLEKGEITGQKNVTMNETFFQGHFPEAPIMPGVLIIEALAQTGGVLVYLKGHVEKIAVLMSVDQAKFRAPVRPGDVMILRGENLRLGTRAGKIHATASVNDRVVVEAEIGFALVEKATI